MARGLRLMACCLAAAALLFGAPQRGLAADDAAKKNGKADDRETGSPKDKRKGGKFRGGVNRAFDGFKKETSKGRKNLNELYEREKAK